MALLTPSDIRNHVFPIVRFKEGYNIEKVDDFLDEVTDTVEALGSAAAHEGATQSYGPELAKHTAGRCGKVWGTTPG